MEPTRKLAGPPASVLSSSLLFVLNLSIILLLCIQNHQPAAATSIKPADFDRLVMQCYLGGPSSYSSASSSAATGANPNGAYTPDTWNGAKPPYIGSSSSSNGGDPSSLNRLNQRPLMGGSAGGGMDHLGQRVPRANTIDNFVALVSKIEAGSPRLASQPDLLIRALLGRFRMDNYYYDVRSRTPISEQDHRTLNIIPALLANPQQAASVQFGLGGQEEFPEHLLEPDEKCSMYFMLSHFVERTSGGGQQQAPLASLPVSQLSGPLNGQRPPSLQAAGSGYPAVAASQSLGGGSLGSQNNNNRGYPGPPPAFGSPATQNMNSWGVGLSNQPQRPGEPSAENRYGMNVLQPNSQYGQQAQQWSQQGGLRNQNLGSNRLPAPYIDGGGGSSASSQQQRRATEFGVVGVPGQENAALVLNRVLMGLLAASMPARTLRQLAELIYGPTQSLLTTSPRLDNSLDPLYAVTLADIWAVSSIPKPDKPADFRLWLAGDNGHWNDTMCPTSFFLERSPNSARFTTAELLGGLDGLNLGLFRRELMERRRHLRLSDMLRMYYSRQGFRGQYAEVSVCNRQLAINQHLDELRRQAEDYLRLYQLNMPTNDNDISASIQRLDSFKELARQAAQQYAPAELCQQQQDDYYPSQQGGGQNDQCELAKADMVAVLDSSPQANEPFMRLVVAKLAQKVGLSRQGSSLTVLTNQQDSTGYAGTYSFNSIVSNSTNTAEIGCALLHDQSRGYSGGQITEPTRLMEMFERSLVNLDSEYLLRQNMGNQQNPSTSSSQRQSTYASSWFGSNGGDFYQPQATGVNSLSAGGPRNTGGSKVIIWFNFGHQTKPASPASYPTNWADPKYQEQNNYRFQEARRYLRENFRGASILAVGTSRDEVKPFVYDEERDIFTSDVPQANGAITSGGGDNYYGQQQQQSADMALLSGPAEQLVNKLLARMCDIPAIFQYPMCFRQASDQTAAVGYISPQKKQYWMMSPKTFFASRQVRMAFKVEGGRLRVCFGRMSHPDESAQRNGHVLDSSGIILSGGNRNPSGGLQPPSSSANSNNNNNYNGGNNYYTGLESGICKDVAPGQEVDFIVDDPCYKKPIAECEPFYFVIKEISQPGDGDMNYMCRDEGCKRMDQAKFTMTHTGVICSGAFGPIRANWLLIMISSLIVALGLKPNLNLNFNLNRPNSNRNRQLKLSFLTVNRPMVLVAIVATGSAALLVQQVRAQQAGVHDFGQNRYGEKRGNYTPSEVLSIILLVMVILAGLALTLGLCYYVAKQSSRRTGGMTPVKQSDY